MSYWIWEKSREEGVGELTVDERSYQEKMQKMIDWLGILNVIVDCDALALLLFWYQKDRRR